MHVHEKDLQETVVHVFTVLEEKETNKKVRVSGGRTNRINLLLVVADERDESIEIFGVQRMHAGVERETPGDEI